MRQILTPNEYAFIRINIQSLKCENDTRIDSVDLRFA